MFNTSYEKKNNFLKFIGTTDALNVKKKITSNIKKYTTILNKKCNYSDLYRTIWTNEFDSLDPESGWGFENCKLISPLIGKNSDIIPPKSVGCKIDSSCYQYLEQPESYSQVDVIKVRKKDRYKASVFCYVTDNFKKGSICLTIGWSAVYDGIVSKKAVSFYDIRNAGKWQKLTIEFTAIKDGDIPIYLDIYDINNFSNMNGHVIFAYPSYNKIEFEDRLMDINGFKDGLRSEILNIGKDLNNGVEINVIEGELVSFNKALGGYLIDNNESMRASFFGGELIQLIFLNKNLKEDLIKKMIVKFVSEDTTYFPYKSDLNIDAISSNLKGSRINRWKFAIQIFTKEYNWKEKLFGGGFEFLNWYGYYFLKDKTKSDWPHNPFLHILLYSGIFGLAFYIYFMFKVFYYYIKYRKEYYIFFIFFLITFFFTFFSGGNPFDPPIMGFFVVLPFFIHSVHKRENKKLMKI